MAIVNTENVAALRVGRLCFFSVQLPLTAVIHWLAGDLATLSSSTLFDK
jgi:hypothetical protein